MALKLLSEPYSPSGSMVGKTMGRAVRNTSLDEWSILLRETLQNSFDARLSSSRPITYYVSLDEAVKDQRKALRQDIFSNIPKEMSHLKRVLAQDDLPLLVIADWETRGLCGPTRADFEADERTDFQDFFLNVGREDKKAYQGGTFGLGRGVLFEISRAGSIVVFTRTASEGKPVSRLMAMGISGSYSEDRRKFTGRHWWGATSAGTWPEPLTGDGAVRLAQDLGLDVIPEGTTGTAILVVAPRIPDSWEGETSVSLAETLDAMIDAALLYGWPLMIGRKGKPEVHFQFSHGGEAWEPLLPDSAESPVRDFAEAYRLAIAQASIDGPTSWHEREINFGAGRAKPQPLGKLVFRHVPPLMKDPETADDAQIPSAAIALMREPRMVVRYYPVPKHPMGSDTRGVFVLNSEFDQQFAESEPVAHDDWIPAKIASAKSQRNPVRQALDKVRQAVKETLTPSKGGAVGDLSADGLAPVVADLLGGMLADAPGPGGTPPKPSPGGGGGVKGTPKASRVSVLTPNLRLGASGSVEALFPVKVSLAADRLGTLRGEPRVVLDSGLESSDEIPEGSERPAMLGWEAPDGSWLSADAEVRVPRGLKELVAVVQQPRDVAVTLAVTLSEAPDD